MFNLSHNRVGPKLVCQVLVSPCVTLLYAFGCITIGCDHSKSSIGHVHTSFNVVLSPFILLLPLAL